MPRSSRPASPLKQARTDLDLRLVDVAEKAGCSVSLVSMTESGYVPPLDTRARIACAVGASAGSFWPLEAA
jgi:transcriptional regulator with XRE-family HTH domain